MIYNIWSIIYNACACAFPLRRLAHNDGPDKTMAPGDASGISPVNFHTNGSYDMSMCISTAQARAKRVSRY